MICKSYKILKLMHTQRKTINFSGQNFYVGLDVHLKSWTVTILGQDYEHKTYNCSPSVKEVATYLNRSFPGATFNLVYEAGFSGF